MAKAKKQTQATEERLADALVPENEQPYDVPENWVWVRWKYCGNLTAGSGFKPALQGFTQYSIPFYKVGSLKHTDDYGYLYDEANTVSEEMRTELKAILIQVNSIIFAKIGEAIRLNRRSMNLVPCCIDNNLMAFLPNDFCFYKYSFYWSKSKDFYELANATTVPAIRKSDLERLCFPLPPLPEQHRIVARIESLFEKLDRAKDLVQSALDSFETRKAAILHKAFTGELTATWREKHGVGIESWEERPLSELCSSFQYGTSKKSDKYGKVVVLRMGNLQNGDIDWSDLAYSNDAEDNEKYKLSPGDVLFNRTNSPEHVGKTSVYRGDIPAIFAGYLIRINYGKSLDGYYLNYVMNSQRAREYCRQVKTDGVNQSNINAKKLADFTIPHCSIAEQQEIVRILGGLLEKEKTAQELSRRIEKIDYMKKAILARAFRGELGTNDASEESALGLLDVGLYFV